MPVPACVVFDLDGTLVDSNYHHALAWVRAFARSGGAVPTLASVHRLVGMGGDQLLPRLTGRDEPGVSAARAEEFARLRPEIRPLPGATRAILAAHDLGATVVVASSGEADEVADLLSMLAVDGVIDHIVTNADIAASKPAPDAVEVALAKAGVAADDALFVGDTVWDVEAATRAGVRCVAVTTGGICRGELEAAGATAVYDSLDAVADAFDLRGHGNAEYVATGARTLAGVLTGLEEHGFTGQVRAEAGAQVRCLTCGQATAAERLTPATLERLEGASDPAEMMAVAALECPHCRTRATLVLTYGPLSPPEHAAVLAAFEERGMQVDALDRPAR